MIFLSATTWQLNSSTKNYVCYTVDAHDRENTEDGFDELPYIRVMCYTTEGE